MEYLNTKPNSIPNDTNAVHAEAVAKFHPLSLPLRQNWMDIQTIILPS